MKLVIVFLAVVIAGASCGGRGADTDEIELQRVRSGDLDVVVLSKDGTLSHDKDTVTLEFRRGSDLVDVGMVKGRATMPMAGMSPMMGSVFLERGDVPGRYKADTDLSMSGGWQLQIEWDGPAGKGNALFNATVD